MHLHIEGSANSIWYQTGSIVPSDVITLIRANEKDYLKHELGFLRADWFGRVFKSMMQRNAESCYARFEALCGGAVSRRLVVLERRGST